MSSINLEKLLGFDNLSDLLNKVDAQIESEIDGENPQLSAPAKRFFNSGGKKLRASLLIAFASKGKNNNKSAIKLAAAVELLHLASLIHDDIIDKSATRRGVPSVYAKEGSDQAIVVGDFLFGKAFKLAAEVSAEAAGCIGQAMVDLCDGQSRELAEQDNLERSESSYLKAIEGKTARLFATSCYLGALISGREELKKPAFKYGLNFGMAFQIVDDILDIAGNPQKIGKPTGNDIKSGVYTLPLIMGVKNDKVKSANEEKLSKLAKAYVDESKSIAFEYCKQASTALSQSNTKIPGPLIDFPISFCITSLRSLL